MLETKCVLVFPNMLIKYRGSSVQSQHCGAKEQVIPEREKEKKRERELEREREREREGDGNKDVLVGIGRV